MIVKLELSPDSTFLSQLIYEGILYALYSVPGSSFRLDEVDLPDDFLHKAYSEMDDGRINEISIVLTGNDRIEKFLESLKIQERPSKKTYRELIKLLKEKCKDISLRKEITLQTRRSGDNIFLDKPDCSNLAAPQLFKIDRYTGISMLETGLTSKQLGLKSSPEAVLIGLMGIYSSHITTIRQQNSTYHYFVFLSPDEVVDVLSSGDHFKLKSIYSIKELLRDLLSTTLRSSVVSEVMVLEVMLSTKIRSELESKNLDKVDFNVFKISPEGQTYKIYETIPITVYRKPMFYEVLLKRGIKADEVCEKLYEALSPDGVIMEALASFNSRNKYSEADAILRGVLGLYKFVSLADAQGLFQFLRSLEEARTLLKDDRRAHYRVEEYARIERSLI